MAGFLHTHTHTHTQPLLKPPPVENGITHNDSTSSSSSEKASEDPSPLTSPQEAEESQPNPTEYEVEEMQADGEEEMAAEGGEELKQSETVEVQSKDNLTAHHIPPPPLIPIAEVPKDSPAPSGKSTPVATQTVITAIPASSPSAIPCVPMVFYVPQHTPIRMPSTGKLEAEAAPEGGKEEWEAEGAAGCDTPPVVPSHVQVEGAHSAGAVLFAESPLHSLAAAAAVAASSDLDR